MKIQHSIKFNNSRKSLLNKKIVKDLMGISMIKCKKLFSNSDVNKKIENFKEELNKLEKDQNDEEIIKGDFFKFMDENIQKETDIFINKKLLKDSKNDINDDINELIKLVKCPITEDNLEACEEGLKISVFIFIFNLLKYSILFIQRETESIF